MIGYEYAVCKCAVEKYGAGEQQLKAIEEMSELIKALLKLRFCTKDYERPIIQDAVDEEMADVEIMLEQLKIIFNNRDSVGAQMKKKIERLERRMSGED